MPTRGVQIRLGETMLAAASAEHETAARVTRRAYAQCGHPAETRRW